MVSFSAKFFGRVPGSMGLVYLPTFGKCRYTLPETNSSPLKMDGKGILLSYWEGLFSGAMLVSGSVYTMDPMVEWI